MENLKKLLQESKEDIDAIINANLFSQHNMTYSLINYCKDIDNIDFLSQKIEFENFNFEIDNEKIKYSPIFLHYHEIILFDFLKKINGEDNFTFNDIKTNEEYINFNYLDKDYLEEKLPKLTNSIFDIKSDDEKKNKLKIGIVSIKVDLQNVEKSYLKSPNLSYNRLQKIFDILNLSIKDKNQKPDLLIFPEVSIPYAWIHLMVRFAKKNDIGLIFGVEHINIKNKVSNYTCVMLPFKIDTHISLFINFDLKRHYAPAEILDIEGNKHLKINSNLSDKPQVYNWRNTIFSTLNCYELTDISLRTKLVGEIDFLVAIEYNKDINYFSNIIESASRDIHCYIIQVNTSDYGDSRITQPTKTEIKDIAKIKGGQNVYLVIDEIDIKKLRKFQSQTIAGQDRLKIYQKYNLKYTPANFKMSNERENISSAEKKED